LLGIYLVFLVGADGTVTNPADPDLWHRLAVGEVLWKTGHFPSGDAFSYLYDYKRVIDHEWGCAALFYAFYQWRGMDVFVLVKLVNLGLTLALLVYAGLPNRGLSMYTTAFYALVLLALLPSFQGAVGCTTYTHIFFALWLLWFQRERHGYPVPLYLYIVTMILWANLHGGFAIGLAWLFLAGLVELIYGGLWQRWVIRFACCALATMVNPFGPELWVSTGRALLITRRGFGEWAPVSWWPDVMAYPGYKLLFLGLLVALIGQLARKGWKEVDRPAFTLLFFFMFLSMTSARHTSLFAAVAGALAPGLFQRIPEVRRTYNPVHRLGAMALGTVLLIIPCYSALIILPIGAGLSLEYPRVSCPADAVGYLLRQNVRGNLLVPFNYGSYALWQLRGRMRVSMDGRYDLVYRPETYQRVDDFFGGRGDWRKLLSVPDAILVPKADPVYALLLQQPGWKVVYQDDTDTIFMPLLR